ncbi:MAG: hypothetical protein ACX932_02095 [Gammaproteobacteria bacterium]
MHSKRIAIADFVKGWYFSHHRKAFEINKGLQEIHMKVNKHLLAGQRKKLEGESSRSETFVQRTAQVYDVAHAVYQKLDDNDKYSDSESDSGKEETDRKRNMYDVIAYIQYNSHYLKSIKRLLIKEGYSDIAENSKQLKKYSHNNTHIQLTIKDWKKIRKEIQQLLSDNKNEVTITQFEDRLKALIEEKSTISLSVEHNKLKTQLNRYEEELNQRKRELSQKDDKIAQLEKELLKLKRPSRSERQFFSSSRSNAQKKRKRPQSSQSDGNKANPKKPRN